jgi:hypothetical protein
LSLSGRIFCGEPVSTSPENALGGRILAAADIGRRTKSAVCEELAGLVPANSFALLRQDAGRLRSARFVGKF